MVAVGLEAGGVGTDDFAALLIPLSTLDSIAVFLTGIAGVDPLTGLTAIVAPLLITFLLSAPTISKWSFLDLS